MRADRLVQVQISQSSPTERALHRFVGVALPRVHVLSNGRVREQHWALGQVPDCALQVSTREVIDAHPANRHLAETGRDHAEDDTEQRRFARPARADDDGEAPLGKVDGDVLERVFLASRVSDVDV